MLSRQGADVEVDRREQVSVTLARPDPDGQTFAIVRPARAVEAHMPPWSGACWYRSASGFNAERCLSVRAACRSSGHPRRQTASAHDRTHRRRHDRHRGYPRVTAGTRCAPPEDVGSISGLDKFLVAMADPEHEQHERMLHWDGPPFDPEDIGAPCLHRVMPDFAARRRGPLMRLRGAGQRAGDGGPS
jgi:hypothetical protein